ncbi:LPS export ABC transporter permease LptF [Aestuariicella hydrocarbonica]|uniref:Lipopolysaccharide export system permease protein LptF n=1 Tax=Pseudomaricurvus hydrocarbonicus TaxID=1470433 RepID=A0A9E5JVA5_9GAMM|nr:LPS export ABC transporter permease LptF [Aestuariicella hydrocarbonica]NHO65205.1 LPS export ABC transporter permease LptF [Aestuariicella hydrocarbonica]
MIIFRYLAREVMVSMVAVSGVLLLIIMSGRFVKYLAEAAAGKLDPDVLFAVMGFRLPGFLELILPLGLFIAFLLAYGRLYMDSEMTVLSACGMSQRRLVGYSMLPAGIVAAFVALLSLWISPVGIHKANMVLESQKKRTEFELLSPARFQETSSGKSVTYAERFSDDHKVMRDVFMAEMGSSSDSDQVELAVITAESGEQVTDPVTGQRYLKLNNGYRYSGNPGEANYEVVEFESYWQHMVTDDKSSNGDVKADSLPTRTLMQSSSQENIAALHWRFSLPVLVLVVTLLAVPLSKTNPRQGRYVQMIPAILLYIIYLVSLNAARGAVEEGSVSPWLSIWAVHLVALLIALLLLFWPYWRLRLKARRSVGGAQRA